MKFHALAIAAAVIVAGASAGAASHDGSALESLTIAYSTSSCAPVNEPASDLASPIAATVVGISQHRRYEAVVAVGSKPGPYVARFDVIPDAYYIHGQQEKTGCVPAAGRVAVVLPGHPIRLEVDVAQCCRDVRAFSYAAGLVAPGLDVNIARATANLGCGSPVPGSRLVLLEGDESFRRDGNAYYAQLDPGVSPMVLQIARGAQQAFVRLELAPNGHISVSSTFRRLDVTEALFDLARTSNGALYCGPSASMLSEMSTLLPTISGP
ncbi:MAG TPA: hypothetical protein VGX91_15250 [Candidatus Cybelea sp.]|jgi:hypothetical protein|nr:hypothetical protein [Candidatus Cybelea sp.]